jgi:type II secretory pathway component GspD/PulD (secretin)
MNNNGVSQPSSAMTRAPGETIQDLLMGLIQSTIATNSWSNAGGQGTIQYYPLGMALVVNQTQEVQEDVAALLASLRRLQDLEVAIEMRLVSVSESFFERIGVDFNVNLKSPTHSTNQIDLVNGQFTPFGQVNSQFQGIKAVTGLTPAGTLTPDLGIPIKTGSFDFSIPPFGGYPGTIPDGGISLGLAFLSDIQVFMFLEAAQGDRRMNIMQAPKITVFNGQTANISVNDFQFFLTGVSINQANGQIFFSPNNQPFPLGVTMQVTPVVSADRRFVRLNLTPNLTNLANANVPLIPVQIPVPQLLEGPGNASQAIGQPSIFQMFFQQPTFTSITVNTTVNVPDGGTVLLGGLKTMSEGRNESGPPILGKIPYLNRLFTNTAYGRDGQSLMIMVTPRIIINEEETEIFVGNQPPIPRP